MQSVISNPFHNFYTFPILSVESTALRLRTRWASERQIGCRRRNHQRHSSRFWKHEIGRSVKNDGRKEVKENTIRKKDYTLWSKSCYHNGSVFAIKPSNRFLSHESFYFPAPCIGTFGKEKKFYCHFHCAWPYDVMTQWGDLIPRKPRPRTLMGRRKRRNEMGTEMEWKQADYPPGN